MNFSSSLSSFSLTSSFSSASSSSTASVFLPLLPPPPPFSSPLVCLIYNESCLTVSPGIFFHYSMKFDPWTTWAPKVFTWRLASASPLVLTFFFFFSASSVSEKKNLASPLAVAWNKRSRPDLSFLLPPANADANADHDNFFFSFFVSPYNPYSAVAHAQVKKTVFLLRI